ncbi:hypothetical protein [Cognatilysobacter bugurensis]|uniref:DUF4402 domain-containing protein n=1 Tax=Cognatilysobacter bugurensis TaxID=543356 RepID=A0A918T2J9_9GAMM|nr:hypothetical protein [Lysobacter bugurensis]GHA87721.1 hypothetical protein GCM10007067_27190 [Lysobacter bugurensis]
MSRRIARLALLLLAAPLLAGAQTALPVDDHASEVLGGPLRMRWDTPAGRHDASPTVSGEVAVRVRLDVAPWQGRQARIFMTLPPQAGTRVDAHWTTRGVLLPGALRDGERALVYAGPLRGPQLEDVQQLTIRADGARLVRPEQLHFAFEIELESP